MTSHTDPLEPYYFQHEQETICGCEVTPITNEFVENYPTVVDRFFTRFYHIKCTSGSMPAPYQVLFHSNRICLICLAPEHPALRAGITSLSFDIGNADRSKNCVKGKGKKGGMVLQADSTLALITADDGQVYKIPSCVRSKLVEVNVDLANEPKRLETVPEGEGYLAIVLPKPEHCDEIKASLLTHEEYMKIVESGGLKQNSTKEASSSTNIGDPK